MATWNYVSCIFCHRATVVRRIAASRCLSAVANPQSQADFLNKEPHKRHPGVTHLKTLRLPDELLMAARSIIERSQVIQLPERARKLTNFLWSRKRAAEDSTVRKKAVSLEKELWKKAMEKGGDLDEQAVADRIKRDVLSELRRTFYHWTPLKYDEELGMVYMVAKLAGGYAAVRRALNEIKKRDPTFAPQSLLDFGSGLGTVAWASHACWSATLNELVCVDISGSMNILAERLLKGDGEHNEAHIKHVYFRQFLPISPKVQFDLVASAFTLSEIPGAKEREEAVITLWRKTASYLLLVENGTKEGHQILMDARDSILQNKDKIVHDTRPASVFAPCPHEASCPKLALPSIVPCNFQQVYMPLYGRNSLTERFSYLIMTRERHRTQAEGAVVDWSRLIAPPKARTRHVHCHLCRPDGQLEHVVVTASKHGRDVYRCARNSEWGDRLPLVQDNDNQIEDKNGEPTTC
ncbi:methyltransferase-like protein 17, mitochondrial [Hippocampus zosterae]|uniref:methyltransferase-like protein 17, mitochondrial n=1 Tax=Hippocampus zosterae TaxID=109293 RepID=UPI00223CD2E4|nr:methyltransferase-like protein 17, mitochondrial [Hippocampus zosterae]